jgi:reductive dehalogenase
MKGIALAGAGLGTALASAPVFRDIDELTSSASGLTKHPWWVKTVDESTTEVDWNVIKRFEQTYAMAYLIYPDYDKHFDNIKQDVQNNVPGNTLRDLAIFVGSEWNMFGWPAESGASWVTHPDRSGVNYVQDAYTHADLGVPRWTGTPEENLQMLRAAVSWYGGVDGGAIEIDSKVRKMILSTNYYGQRIVFSDVEEATETPAELVIPNKCKWIFNYHVVQNKAQLRTGLITHLSYSAIYMAYAHCDLVQRRLQEFMHILGYQALGRNQAAIIALATMTGLGEQGRHYIEISPEHGSQIREPMMIITDLPLATTKPIDFGARRFCHTCGICAEHCPGGAIPADKEPSWDVAGFWNMPGVKTWYNDRQKCQPYGWKYDFAGGCSNCQATCPFSSMHAASIHEVVGATVSHVPVLNSFMANMDTFFEYGLNNRSEDWWSRDLSSYQWDTTLGK